MAAAHNTPLLGGKVIPTKWSFLKPLATFRLRLHCWEGKHIFANDVCIDLVTCLSNNFLILAREEMRFEHEGNKYSCQNLQTFSCRDPTLHCGLNCGISLSNNPDHSNSLTKPVSHSPARHRYSNQYQSLGFVCYLHLLQTAQSRVWVCLV